MSTQPGNGTAEVVVGRIGKPHGIRGELFVEPRSDEPDRRFADGAVLRVQAPAGREPAYDTLRVVSTRWHQGRLLVRFRGIEDRDAAEAVRGLLLTTLVALDEAPEDPEEFYDHQLVGLRVVTTEGVPVGVVADVLHPGAQDLLVVDREGREEALVPFVSALVPEVDVAAGRLVVADRPGLLGPLEED